MVQKAGHIILTILLGLPFTVWGQKCRVGDVVRLTTDESVGLVFWINPEKTAGWMVSLKDIPDSPWGIDVAPLSSVREPLIDTNGYLNTLKIRELYPDEHAIAAWQVDFKRGWYLPALGQLIYLKSLTFMLNPLLEGYGGDPMDGVYWSSTVPDVFYYQVYICNIGGESFVKTGDILKYRKVRAVRSFSMAEVMVSDNTLSYTWNTGATTAEITDKPGGNIVYTVEAMSPQGCKTKVSQAVFVASSAGITVYDTIRQGEKYTKYGFDETESGVYAGSIHGKDGCEGKVTLYLTVLEPILPTEYYDTICQGEFYSQHNFGVWEEGEYTQKWLSQTGQDSLIILHLSVIPSYYPEIDVLFCEDETYVNGDFEFRKEGRYTLPLKTKEGCDSVISVNLSVTPVYRFFEEDTICQGETYFFRGRSVSEGGAYYDSLRTINGCDSIYGLHLTVLPAVRTYLEGRICEGEAYEGHGFSVSSPGDYEHRYLSVAGCDSVVHLHLTVLPAVRTYLEGSICEGEVYEEHGFSVSSPGDYEHRYLSVAGCDSVVRLHLTVLPAVRTYLEGSICEGEVYEEHGFSVSSPGDYEHRYLSVAGCDSVVRLHLTVLPAVCIYLEGSICEGEVYEEHGFSVSSPGDYEHRYLSVAGCDSVVHLHLSVKPFIRGEITPLLLDCDTKTYRFPVRFENFSGEERFEWDFGDGSGSSETVPVHSYADTGSYRISLRILTDLYCRSEIYTNMTTAYYRYKLPLYFMPEKIVSSDPRIILWTEEHPDIDYLWSLGNGEELYGARVKYTYPSVEYDYYEVSLKAADSDRCQARYSVRIPVIRDFSIPNTFSPNNDGVNDFFMQGYRVEILDRNGNRVFSGSNGWDGTGKQGMVPEDTYFYILYYTTEGKKESTLKGYVTLSR